MLNKTLITIIVLSLSAQLNATTLEKVRKLHTHISGSYIVGAQIFNDNILYEPGCAINLSNNYQLKKRVSLGLGIGYLSLVDENFYPIYTEFTGYKSKDKNSPLVKFQIGYSLAGNKLTKNMNYYDMKGGIYFDWAAGYKWNLNENYSIISSFHYTQQFSKLAYTMYNSFEHIESVDYAMIRFSFGITIH